MPQVDKMHIRVQVFTPSAMRRLYNAFGVKYPDPKVQYHFRKHRSSLTTKGLKLANLFCVWFAVPGQKPVLGAQPYSRS